MKLRALALLVLAAPLAEADTPPNMWEIAKKPAIRQTWEVHVQARRLMATAEELKETPKGGMDPALFLERALLLLESAGARTSEDRELRFDLADCLRALSRNQEAVEILKPLLEEKDVPHEVWLDYAFANAYTEDSAEERRAYERYLDVETDTSRRLTPMLNMAEADMRLGLLERSISEYREALRLSGASAGTNGFLTTCLAQWGLAVALDRLGDRLAAEKAADLATSYDPPAKDTGSYALPSRIPTGFGGAPFIQDRKNVFFVPAYERNWYLALGEQALARAETKPAYALAHWRAVERLWSMYVTQAKLRGDRWLKLAEAHLASAQKKVAELAAKANTPRSFDPLDF